MTNSYDIDILRSLTINPLNAKFSVEIANDKYCGAEEKNQIQSEWRPTRFTLMAH